MPKIDLSFPVVGGQIPADHGYLLYSAVSRLLPAAHPAVGQPFQADKPPADDYGIHPIRGRQLGGRTLQLTEHSRLVIRVEAEQIARFLPLAGKQLRFLDRTLRIGVPQVRSLVPAPALRSRVVTIKLPEMAAQCARCRGANIPRFRATEAARVGYIRRSGAFARQTADAADQGQGSGRLRGDHRGSDCGGIHFGARARPRPRRAPPHTIETARQTAWEQTGDLAECDLTPPPVDRMRQIRPPD